MVGRRRRSNLWFEPERQSDRLTTTSLQQRTLEHGAPSPNLDACTLIRGVHTGQTTIVRDFRWLHDGSEARMYASQDTDHCFFYKTGRILRADQEIAFKQHTKKVTSSVMSPFPWKFVITAARRAGTMMRRRLSRTRYGASTKGFFAAVKSSWENSGLRAN